VWVFLTVIFHETQTSAAFVENGASTKRQLTTKAHPSSQPSPLPSPLPSTTPTVSPTSDPSSTPSSQPSVCMDEPGWVVGGTSVYAGMSCADIGSQEGDIGSQILENWCSIIERDPGTVNLGKSISVACCECGGGDHQSIAPSTSSPTLHAYPSATPSSRPSMCIDEPGWHFDTTDGGDQMGCESFNGNPEALCEQFASFIYKQKTVALACCVCGGGSSQAPICIDEPGWIVGGDSMYSGMGCVDIGSQVENWCSIIERDPDTVYLGKSISLACCECGGGDHQSIAPSTSSPTLHAYPSVTPSSRPSTCIDEPGWHFDTTDDADGGAQMGCESLNGNPAKLCEQFASFVYKQKTVALACCVCGGGDHQSVAPSTIPTSNPSLTPSETPSVSSAPSDDPSTYPSSSPSDIPSTSPSDAPTESTMPSNVPTGTYGSILNGEPCSFDSECLALPFWKTADSQRRLPVVSH